MWENGMSATGHEAWLVHAIYHGLLWAALAALLIVAVVLIARLVERHDLKRRLR